MESHEGRRDQDIAPYRVGRCGWDGRKELINAPLIGAKALAPKYEDSVPLFHYRQGDWKRLLIDDQMLGILNRVRPVFWNVRPAKEVQCCLPKEDVGLRKKRAGPRSRVRFNEVGQLT
jgi:hypothetical protein